MGGGQNAGMSVGVAELTCGIEGNPNGTIHSGLTKQTRSMRVNQNIETTNMKIYLEQNFVPRPLQCIDLRRRTHCAKAQRAPGKRCMATERVRKRSHTHTVDGHPAGLNRGDGSGEIRWDGSRVAQKPPKAVFMSRCVTLSTMPLPLRASPSSEWVGWAFVKAEDVPPGAGFQHGCWHVTSSQSFQLKAE